MKGKAVAQMDQFPALAANVGRPEIILMAIENKGYLKHLFFLSVIKIVISNVIYIFGVCAINFVRLCLQKPVYSFQQTVLRTAGIPRNRHIPSTG